MDPKIKAESVSYGALLRKKGFVPYLIAEFLSAFSDNIFKFFLMFLVSSMFDRDTSAEYISLIGVIFVAPYLLFLGYSGYLSDRFSKRSIFVYVKMAEIIITGLVLLSLVIGNLWFMFFCLFLMMTRSCVFFPAKVGLVPELLEKRYLSLANSLLWMSMFIASVLGALLGGALFQVCEDKSWVVGAILMLVAVIGYWNSKRLPEVDFVPLDKPFPKNPWRDIIDSVKTIRRRKSILVAILGIGWFWFLGALFQTILPLYGREILGIGEFHTSLLQGFIALGIASGCITAGWLSRDTYEPGLIPFGSLGVAIGTLWVAFSGDSYIQTAFAFSLTGFSSGIFIIPIYTFLHQRAQGNERGRIFATANYVDTLGMLMASGAYWVFAASVFKLPEDKILAFFGLVTLAITIYALKTLPIFFFRVVNFLITRVAYRIKVLGLENIPEKGGVILAPNHVSYIDGLLLWAACRKRNISFMIHHQIYHAKALSWLFKILRYIPVYDGKRVKESLDIARAHLASGGTICIFPEGELTRTGSMMPFRRGVEKLIESIQSKNVPVIPVYIDQLWGSIFSYERGRFFFKVPHDFPSNMSITFGQPLPADASTQDIRKKVTELGYRSVMNRKATSDILPTEMLKIAKKRWFSKILTMPQMKSISYGQLLAKAFNFIVVLQHKLRGSSKTIGVVGVPSLFTVVSNITLMLMNKKVVNFSTNISRAAILKACQRHKIDELLVFKESLDFTGVPVHFIQAEDLKASGVKSWIQKLMIFTFPSRFLVNRILGNTATPDDIVAILFDSGDPNKPIHLSHYNILSNAEGFAQLLFTRTNDWVLGESDYCASVGYIGQLWYPLLNGVGIACSNAEESKLTVTTVNALMRQYQITLLISKSSFYKKMLSEGKALTFPNVRFAVAIGGLDEQSMYVEFEEKIKIELFEGVGSAELPLVIAINHHSYVSKHIKQLGVKKGSMGKPLPGILLEVIDAETGLTLPANESGLLKMKGPNIPVNVLTIDGWVHTGRKAMIDADGFLYLLSSTDE